MKKDEFGDCMFIIMEGNCGVYLTLDEHGAADAVVSENQVLGDKALHDTNGKRAATVIALTKVIALILKREDYQSIIGQHKVIEKMRRFHFL